MTPDDSQRKKTGTCGGKNHRPTTTLRSHRYQETRMRLGLPQFSSQARVENSLPLPHVTTRKQVRFGIKTSSDRAEGTYRNYPMPMVMATVFGLALTTRGIQKAAFPPRAEAPGFHAEKF